MLREANTKVALPPKGVARTQAAAEQASSGAWAGFLGGMDEGRSYGLRKWFSNHGGGLQLCTRLEACFGQLMQLKAAHLQELETSSPCRQAKGAEAAASRAVLTERLVDIQQQASVALRDMAAGVPVWAQDQGGSSANAHPHVPFWPRLFSAVQSLEAFDPEDDDVVEFDPKAEAAAAAERKAEEAAAAERKAEGIAAAEKKAEAAAAARKAEEVAKAEEKSQQEKASQEVSSAHTAIQKKTAAQAVEAASPGGEGGGRIEGSTSGGGAAAESAAAATAVK